MVVNDGYLIVLFDLPVKTKEERKRYSRFRRNLLKNGYLMLQKSIYYKYIRELRALDIEKNKIHKYCPMEGNIKIIRLTKKQFESIASILGDKRIDNTFIDYIEY